MMILLGNQNSKLEAHKTAFPDYQEFCFYQGRATLQFEAAVVRFRLLGHVDKSDVQMFGKLACGGAGKANRTRAQAECQAKISGSNVGGNGLAGGAIEIISDPNAEGFYRNAGAIPIGEVISSIEGQQRRLPRLAIEILRTGDIPK